MAPPFELRIAPRNPKSGKLEVELASSPISELVGDTTIGDVLNLAALKGD